MLGLLLAPNLALLAGVAFSRFRWLLRSNAFFAADLLVTVALQLWAASILQHGTVFLPGPDVMWAYICGTLALWTVVRGIGTGAVLLGGGLVLEFASAWVNGMGFRAGWVFLLGHFLYLCVAFILAWFIMRLARRGAQVVVAEGLRAGREAARADALRKLHEPALQTLARLARLATEGEPLAEERLREGRGIALNQISDLRTELDQADARARGGLAGGLEALATEFRGMGLRVELLTAELDSDPPAPVTEALVRAAREALTNVTKHAGVAHVVVRAANSADWVEVTVRDQGRGFDPQALTSGYGLAHAVRQRMVDVGGEAEVWSAQGRGVRVRLRWSLR